MRRLLALLLVVAAGCCSHPAHGDATRAAAESNVQAFEHVKTYVTLHGRTDTDEATAARTLTLKRLQAWCAQAHAIRAAVNDDKAFDARAAYEACGEVDVP